MPEDCSDGKTMGTINPPNLSSSLKIRCRAIKGAEQAQSILASMQAASKEQNLKNARIMSKYNSEKPQSQSALEADGLGWKNNFTTKPLPMLIDKVAPRFVKAIEDVKYVTNSALPESYPGAAKKTEAFRREITSTLRSNPEWRPLIADISQENALFGFTSVALLDEFRYMPEHFRQDEFFVPTGNKQTAKGTQIWVGRRDYLLHELFSLVEHREAADTAGYNVPEVVKLINSAMPEGRKSRSDNWERVYEDLIREASVGASYESGALTVPLWHFLVTEVNGKVSHYMFSESNSSAAPSKDQEPNKGWITVFERDDRFDSMADALALFSFQHGNGKLKGSKGIGREIYSMAAMLDRARNEVVDRLNLSGKLVIQCDDKALRRFKMSVVGNAILIGQGYTISERKYESNVEAFLELDAFLTRLLDQMAGATTPKAFEGERVTKAEVDLVAGREEESRDNIISRFLTHFSVMITTIQKRMCDPQCADEDAKEMQKRLLEIMTREELNLLSTQAVAETVKDYTEMERQVLTIIASEARGNTLYNQREMERRKLSAQISEEFADAVLLPEEDPTVVAEQTRLQQLELMLLIQQATEVPISPRDNDVVHLGVMLPALESAGQHSMDGGTEALETLNALFAHADAHFQSAVKKGADKEALAPFEATISKLKAAIPQLNALAQHEQAVTGQQQQIGPVQPPPPP